MNLQAITLMEAYIIENLRSHGVSDEEIIRVDEESINAWEKLDDRFDYTLLKKLAKQNRDQFSAIINEGYTVKFLTLNGLLNLIQLKLGKKRDIDFVVHDDGISRFVVNPSDQKVVQQLLSSNWTMIETDHGISIRSLGNKL